MIGPVALEGTALAQALRVSRWGYAAVNSGHVFGIALPVGAIVPLNLRLLGLWPGVPREPLVRVLVPVAAAGLVIAVAFGLALFAVRAREYAGIGFWQAKVALVALSLHRAHGFLLEGAGDTRLRLHAMLSTACWLGALICGRLIAFADP